MEELKKDVDAQVAIKGISKTLIGNIQDLNLLKKAEIAAAFQLHHGKSLPWVL